MRRRRAEPLLNHVSADLVLETSTDRMVSFFEANIFFSNLFGGGAEPDVPAAAGGLCAAAAREEPTAIPIRCGGPQSQQTGDYPIYLCYMCV